MFGGRPLVLADGFGSAPQPFLVGAIFASPARTQPPVRDVAYEEQKQEQEQDDKLNPERIQ